MNLLYALLTTVALTFPQAPDLYVKTHGPIQGAWLEVYGYQLTIQKGPTYSAAVMLYRPGNTFPDAVVWDVAGRPRLQRGS